MKLSNVNYDSLNESNQHQIVTNFECLNGHTWQDRVFAKNGTSNLMCHRLHCPKCGYEPYMQHPWLHKDDTVTVENE